MTLQEKFAALTPEQRKQFGGVETEEQFDAFLDEHKLKISDAERQQVREYIRKGVLPITDEELDNVAGGILVPPAVRRAIF